MTEKSKNLNTILLVDDDAIVNFLNKMIIEDLNLNAEVITVVNGKMALDYITSSGDFEHENNPEPDLILLDLNMPLMNGWEFLEEYAKLKESKKEKHNIFILSSSINPKDTAKADLNNDVLDYLGKPLSAEVLKNIIDKFF